MLSDEEALKLTKFADKFPLDKKDQANIRISFWNMIAAYQKAQQLPGFPEHEKLSRISSESQVQGEFLEWLGEQGIRLCRYSEDLERLTHDLTSIPDLLAEYHAINLNELEKEKRRMLQEVNEQRKRTSDGKFSSKGPL